MTFSLPDPELQTEFAQLFDAIRKKYLQKALLNTVTEVPLSQVDRELNALVPEKNLRLLASHGMRGELFFPVPVILQYRPMLLGYYRLLYGYSQKEFYTSRTGFGSFKAMEENGRISPGIAEHITSGCVELIRAGEFLLLGMPRSFLSRTFLDALTLLTLGPQLRGGANNRRGTAGIRAVFEIIHEIVKSSIDEASETEIRITNAAGRTMRILFASDPDIIIREEMRTGPRSIVAIEVKAGHDFSNVHNRLGEAEKSHSKARKEGFTECWTVLNVDRTDLALAKTESPSTNRFYLISELLRKEGEQYSDFRDRIISLTGIVSEE